jgi:MoaA/NifB/PqqE/SkfB family radical SAM enzyme
MKFEWISALYRRSEWLFGRLTMSKMLTFLGNAFAFSLKAKRVMTYPSMLKIDISPLCNLACPTCIHAIPSRIEDETRSVFERQKFNKHQKMSVSQFSAIIEEVKRKTSAISLFYYGDPLMHPNLDELCSIAFKAGMSVHYTTNFSFNLSDRRIEQIALSGVTHITIALDGATQETYQVTRVGGKLERVLSNLERLSRYKRDHGLAYPTIEVQSLKFAHHKPGEIEELRKLTDRFGVDKFTTFDGTHLDSRGNQFSLASISMYFSRIVAPLSKGILPKCYWPYTIMVIKYNGDVLPCCRHRVERQYTDLDGKGVLGNVFETSIREVWNSRNYRLVRDLVGNPQLAETDDAYKDVFCYGCSMCYEKKYSIHQQGTEGCTL